MYNDVIQNLPPELAADTFDDLFEQCCPKPQTERWTEVQWETDLM